MTIIEQIKAEIERLKAKYRKDMYKSNYEGLASGYKIEAYNELLSFLDTLESEKPVPNDLEEAKEAYCEEHNDDCFDATGDKCPHIRNAFIAGAEWQKEHDAELIEIAYNDGITIGMTKQKEQMMDEWLKDRDGCFWDGVNEGKKAMKEQMMKDAVKWLVDDDYDELADKGGFILGSVGIGYNGYYIPYGDLLKLPKED